MRLIGKATTSYNFAAEGVLTGRWAGGDYDTNKIKYSNNKVIYNNNND